MQAADPQESDRGNRATMSRYANYNEISGRYDRTRVPVGVEILLGCLRRSGKPLDRMTLLDAGCGTGSYSRALLEYVHRIEAVDMSPGMLEVACEKLKPFLDEGRIALHRSKIDDLPFADGTFDGVMINQVLHHLDDRVDTGSPNHKRLFREFRRVLRANGVLVINTCSQEQLQHAYWYYTLIPEAAEALRKRYLPVDVVVELLSASGFTCQGRFVPLDALFYGEEYLDPHGPLKNGWRDGDSAFSLVSQQELDRACDRIRDLDAKGELLRFLEHHDRGRKSIGQLTFILASRD